MRALMVGDSHGNQEHIHAVVAVAKENDFDMIVHVGDFGFWPVHPVNRFVELTEKLAVQAGLPFLVIDGNHDYPGNEEDDINGFRSWKFDPDTLLKPGVKWMPRGTVLVIDGKRVMFLGGGISVDLKHRKEGYSWWASEILSEEDIEACRKQGEVDILLSHDRMGIPPVLHQLSFGITVDEMIVVQEHRFRQILQEVNPKLHIHGHFHVKYDVENEEWEGCRTVGLDAENFDSICGLDFETMEVTWPRHDKVDNKIVV